LNVLVIVFLMEPPAGDVKLILPQRRGWSGFVCDKFHLTNMVRLVIY
jgi:hypothetical protein